jgi:hypothetical protein
MKSQPLSAGCDSTSIAALARPVVELRSSGAEHHPAAQHDSGASSRPLAIAKAGRDDRSRCD